MIRLEKLVPPLELCKQIPAGEFADSALVWEYIGKPWDAKETWILKMRCKRPNARFAPAPTVEEIADDLTVRVPGGRGIVTAKRVFNGFWSFTYTEESNSDIEYSDCGLFAPVSALRLWFKVKGIEVKE